MISPLLSVQLAQMLHQWHDVTVAARALQLVVSTTCSCHCCGFDTGLAATYAVGAIIEILSYDASLHARVTTC